MKAPTRRLTRPAGAALNPEVQPLVENLEILNGARGNGMDRAVLLRDLVDLGYVNVTKGAGGKLKPSVPPGGGGGKPDDPTVEFPTAPKGVYAAGGFTNILVAWDSPSYSGHAYAVIYRSQSDNFSTAVNISTTQANLYSDPVGSGTTWYYWVRFVNTNNQEGPLQSTAGIKGVTEADIGDILDQLKGQIDESFLTPTFNSRINDIELTTKKNEDGIYELDGKVLDLNEQTTTLKSEADILAEAAMNAASGVDSEGNERRKVTAEIKLVQKTLVTETGAMAQQILTLTASIGDNKAEIQEAKTAIIKLDEDTGKAIESITQRLDSQESDIDGNKASITSMSETIVKIEDDVEDNAQSVISLTNRMDQQQSEIDDNKASITTQSQTIVEVSKKADDANDKADANKTEINVMSQQLTTVESELGDTKSAVSTNSQTIAKMNADGTTAYEAQWGVKASVGDIQAGIGLTAKQNPDGSTVSQCTVIADQFSVGHVKTDGKEETIYPFIVTTEGVYIDTAYIKAAKIQDLVAGEVVADTVKATASITAPNIKGGTISAASMTSMYLQSDNYVAGSRGYRFTPTNAEFNHDVKINATIEADQIVGDIVSAITKTNGNVASLSGTTDWEQSGSFGNVSVVIPRDRDRTMIISLGLAVQFERGEAYSQGSARVRIVGTYGDFYSREALTPVKSSDSGGTDPYFNVVTVAIPIPKNTVGTMHIYVQSRKVTASRACKIYGIVSAPTTSNIWSAQLITNGGDLA